MGFLGFSDSRKSKTAGKIVIIFFLLFSLLGAPLSLHFSHHDHVWCPDHEQFEHTHKLESVLPFEFSTPQHSAVLASNFLSQDLGLLHLSHNACPLFSSTERRKDALNEPTVTGDAIASANVPISIVPTIYAGDNPIYIIAPKTSPPSPSL